MSDNPDNTSIYNLLINSDPEVVATLSEQLNELTAKGMSINEAFEQINANANKAADSLDQMATRSTEGVTQTTTSVKGLNEQLAEAIRQAEELANAPAPFRETATEYRFGTAVTNPQGGEAGGYAGGGLETADQIPTPASGGTGSLFGVGHALSVAGFMTGVPGLKEAGALVYLEEGFKRVLPLAQQLGEAAAESSPGLTGLISGVTGLSTPMAGLLGIVGPIAIGVGALIIGMAAYNNAVKEASDLLGALIKGQDEYYKFVQTATTEEAKAKVQSLTDSNTETKKKLDENVEIIKKYLTGINIPLPLGEGKEFLKNLEQTGTINAITDKAIQDAIAAAQKYADQIAQNDIFIGRLTGDIQNNGLAANDAAAATKAATQAAIDKANNDAAFQKQLIADTSLSSEQGKKRLDTLQQEGPVIQAQMDALKPYIATNEQAKKQYDALAIQLANTIGEIQFLTNTAIPAAQSAEDLAQKTKEVDEAFKSAAQAHDTYLKAVESSDAQLADQKANAAAKEAEQEKALTIGSLEDSYQRSQIVLAESRKETALAQDTANAIADVRTKLGQKEVADLTNYNRQLFDDQSKYMQDVQKDQTGAYRTERDNLQTHLEKLADIQNKQATSQQDALLNRNFLALAKVQEGRQNEIDAENTAYARKQAAVQQHLQDELADLATHQAEVRTQQFVEYQRKLVDDRLQAQHEIDQKNLDESRKLEAMRSSEVQQLADLTTTESYKIQILRQGFAQELLLYEQQAQQRVTIAARTEQQAAIQAWVQSGKSEGAGTALGLFSRDSGGSFGSGQSFMKGDIAEMFNFGSKSYAIPGAAIVTPLVGGNASPGAGGGNNIPININIAGGSNRDIPRMAADQVYHKLREIFAD